MTAVFVVDFYVCVCVLILLSHCMPSTLLLFDVVYELFLKQAVTGTSTALGSCWCSDMTESAAIRFRQMRISHIHIDLNADVGLLLRLMLPDKSVE